MNWTKALIAGVVGGIVMTVVDFVLHVLILGGTYMKYPEVFRQDDAGVHHFFFVGIMVSIMAAVLFGKTRSVWADGAMGGVTFGFFLGMVIFFTRFYQSLTIEGFPYFLNWCSAGSALIAFVVLGAVLGAMIKKD